MGKTFDLVKVDLMPIRRTSVSSLLSLRKLQENQDLISCRQSEREVGGRMKLGLLDRQSSVSSA